MLRLTNAESSSRSHDEIDFASAEIDDMEMDHQSNRSSRTPCSHHGDTDHDSDGDYMAEEVTESFDEDDEDDEFDTIVTRGRSKRQPAKTKIEKKQKKPKQPKSPNTRSSRTTRAASVRF